MYAYFYGYHDWDARDQWHHVSTMHGMMRALDKYFALMTAKHAYYSLDLLSDFIGAVISDSLFLL